MEQQQLVAFERIVREGGFQRAARSLGVSQAAISGRIQALESELGVPLFTRGGRRATLTAADEAFLLYTRRALDLLAAGREAARHADSGWAGRVTIGVVDSIADSFLDPVIARYRRDHARVALSIRTGHTPQIVQDVADGLVYLGLVHLALHGRDDRPGGARALPRDAGRRGRAGAPAGDARHPHRGR